MQTTRGGYSDIVRIARLSRRDWDVVPCRASRRVKIMGKASRDLSKAVDVF